MTIYRGYLPSVPILCSLLLKITRLRTKMATIDDLPYEILLQILRRISTVHCLIRLPRYCMPAPAVVSKRWFRLCFELSFNTNVRYGTCHESKRDFLFSRYEPMVQIYHDHWKRGEYLSCAEDYV